MKIYQNYIGIDIGKFEFFVALHNQNLSDSYENNAAGIIAFLQDYKDLLKTSFCVLETTGGYELDLLYTLIGKSIDVHRADTRKVKNFIRSYGNAAKTDKLDAKALAKYGAERYTELEVFKPKSQKELELFRLLQRRNDLKGMLVAEKNRSKLKSSALVKASYSRIIESLTEQLKIITQEIAELIKADVELNAKHELLMSIPGIGAITGYELLIMLPELGKLDRRKIAALAGLAPISNDSGCYRGYRRTGHGRKEIKPTMFLAAMGASRTNTRLADFHKRLLQAGKPKMVAYVALMRKIIVIANAKLKEYYLAENHS